MVPGSPLIRIKILRNLTEVRFDRGAKLRINPGYGVEGGY